MEKPDVIVYISTNCKACEEVIEFLQEWTIMYQTKNVNENPSNMKELQSFGVFGTPTIFIAGKEEPILGFQKNKLKYCLGIINKEITHYSSLFDGYIEEKNNDHRF
ncbi:glutaredoxin family protein [Virgibacillus dokdonensis]|uniref:Glutaredoxin n=1 Tax=Virgibacillus dokdonensis TaxID=302167 RepID=A0A2K9J098_9BACI|nr:glutaredoxin family protein [Virgibacillus dokdonensis]AUJ25105.1 Glutaredoxin [Virgibacillus dokdonensis]